MVPLKENGQLPPFSFLLMRVFLRVVALIFLVLSRPVRGAFSERKRVGFCVLPFSFKGSFRFFSTPSKEPSSKETKRGAAHKIQTKEKICVSLPFYFKGLPHGSFVCAFFISPKETRIGNNLGIPSLHKYASAKKKALDCNLSPMFRRGKRL